MSLCQVAKKSKTLSHINVILVGLYCHSPNLRLMSIKYKKLPKSNAITFCQQGTQSAVESNSKAN